jgi:hypothetical protein
VGPAQKASEADGWCEGNRSADLRASPACATTSTPWTSTNRVLYVKLPCPSVPTSCSKVLADATYITRWRVVQTSTPFYYGSSLAKRSMSLENRKQRIAPFSNSKARGPGLIANPCIGPDSALFAARDATL